MPALGARGFDVGPVVVQEHELVHRVAEALRSQLVDGRLGLVVAHAAAEYAVAEQAQEGVRFLQVLRHRRRHVRQVVQAPPGRVQALQQGQGVGQRAQRARRAFHHAAQAEAEMRAAGWL